MKGCQGKPRGAPELQRVLCPVEGGWRASTLYMCQVAWSPWHSAAGLHGTSESVL